MILLRSPSFSQAGVMLPVKVCVKTKINSGKKEIEGYLRQTDHKGLSSIRHRVRYFDRNTECIGVKDDKLFLRQSNWRRNTRPLLAGNVPATRESAFCECTLSTVKIIHSKRSGQSTVPPRG